MKSFLGKRNSPIPSCEHRTKQIVSASIAANHSTEKINKSEVQGCAAEISHLNTHTHTHPSSVDHSKWGENN